MKNLMIIPEIFKSDFVSREAGERLRILLSESITSKRHTEVDFAHQVIASTSFLDEGLAKLYLDFSDTEISAYVSLLNMNTFDADLLHRLKTYRRKERRALG